MNSRRTIALALAAFHVGFLVTIPAASGQNTGKSFWTSLSSDDPREWTGKWPNGSVLTRADLDEILSVHRRWLETEGKEGNPAFLDDCILSNVALVTTDLTGANFMEANLTGAHLIEADLTGANFMRADLSGADLFKVNLTGAGLSLAKLNGADLWQVDLSKAILRAADLSGALLRDADLTDAKLEDADLDGAVFEPKPNSLPYIPHLASVRNLDKLRYEESEAGLVELRNALREAGMRRQERQVNYALLKCRREKMEAKPRGVGDSVDAWFNYYFFEITCKYGLLPGRPLQILGVTVLAFAAPYFMVLWRKERSFRSDIWLEVEDESIRPNRTRKRRFRLLVSAGAASSWRARVRRFRRTLFAAVYFSLLSSFRVGFREINVGNWLARMQCREYTLRATGWIRFVTGLQSLISVSLLALWLLTYFGRPFQ